MPENNFWAKTVPRVEVDHRVREARCRFVRVERLFVPQFLERQSWFKRLVGFGVYREEPRSRRLRAPMSDGHQSGTSKAHGEIDQLWASSYGVVIACPSCFPRLR
jgi:hypothetical protein